MTFLVRSARYAGRNRDGWVEARRMERLPNGLWRVDLSGGLVELFDREPVTRPIVSAT